MTHRALVEKANLLLRELDAVFPGGDGVHPLFQLRWSNDMVSIIPTYQVVDGQPVEVMDYYCNCGVNVVVHSVSCTGLSVAKVRMQKVPTFSPQGEFSSTYANCWIFCRWVPPPDYDAWVASTGTDEDYPSEGRYLPCHAGALCLCLPKNAGAEDVLPAARMFIRAQREHRATLVEQQAARQAKARMLHVPIQDARGNVLREADKGSRFYRIQDRVKERMRRFNPTGTIGYSGTLSSADSPTPKGLDT